MKGKQLRIGLVGCGWAASWHATDLVKLPELFTFVACCDSNEARAREFAMRYQVAATTNDYAALCARQDVDVIVICTPPMLHHEMVLQALAAGKHVVCEKPFVSSLAQVDSVRDAESRSKGRVMPIFQYRFGSGVAKVRHLIGTGLPGKHYVSSCDSARTRGPDYYREAWRGKFATELGGVLVTQSIHSHDLMSWLLGPIAKVAAFKSTRVNPIEVEDCAAASLQLVDGSLLALSATLGSVQEVTRIRMCFEHVTFERVSPQGTRPADDPWTILPRTEQVAAAIDNELKNVPEGKAWFAGQYEQFFHALASDRPFAVTLDDARASLELITALFEASETNTIVSLPLGPTHPRYHGWTPDEGRAGKMTPAHA
jgi:predicted dehydrogenase